MSGAAIGFDHSVRRAVLAVLNAAPVLASGLNRIGDGESETAPVPAAWLGESNGSEWGSKDRPGRDVRLALTLADRGDDERLAQHVAAAEAALTSMPRVLEGWETSGCVISRVRLTRRRDGLRLALIDMRVRGWPAAPAG